LKEEPAETPVERSFPQRRSFTKEDLSGDVSEFKMPREKTE
jgi:hypothetical protein